MTPKQHELLDRYSELILEHPLKFYPPSWLVAVIQ